MTDREARARYIDCMSRLTIWIRQRSNGRWEAIDWYGNCIAEGRTTGEVDRTVRAMARDNGNNIWCIATVTAPEKRREFRNKPTRRSL